MITRLRCIKIRSRQQKGQAHSLFKDPALLLHIVMLTDERMRERLPAK